MNARKILSLFLAIVFAITTFATPVFAAGSKKPNNGKGNVKVMFSKPGNKHDNKGNKGNFKFSDSQEVEWATKAIEKLGLEGVLSGKSGDQYRPKENVTELEALAMILNYTGNKDAAAKYNNKVHPLYKGAKPSWGLGYIFLAIEKKILLPEELKGFNPNTPVKRHEVAKYIVRALGKTDEALNNMDKDLDFKDASAVPEKSVGYVYVATDMGLMKGNDSNEFQPQRPVTRAEMAVILDNADGNSSSDQVTNNITFVSYSDSTDKLTVKQNGKTYTYTVVSNAPVYVDNKYSSLDALKVGDVLRLVFNASRQVIFIEVKTAANESNATDLGTQVSAVSVAYNNLPDAIQHLVSDLKDNENYKAYKYDGYIYLVAARGEKNTGGYSIDISKVYKYKNADNDYLLNVKVTMDDPSSTDIVSQSVTYPYDVVKISYFSGIDKVIFLDEGNDKLAETTVSTQYDDNSNAGLGDEVSVTNVDYANLPDAIQEKVDSLKSEANYKAYRYNDYIYLFASSGQKNTSGYDIVIDNVYKNENSDGDYVLNVKVDITNPSSSDNVSSTKTYPYDVVRIRYFSGIDTVRFLDEDNSELAETTISQQDAEQTVSGLVKSINTSTRILELLLDNGGTSKYIISSSTPITINGDESSFSKLARNMSIKLTLVDSSVTALEAKDTIETVTGILTGISITTEKTITVKVGSSYKSYSLTSDTKIYEGSSEKGIADLSLNDELSLKFVNGVLSEITIN